MEEAARLCDRLVIMDNGKILAEGNPKDLVRKHVASNVVEAKNSPQIMECVKKHELHAEDAGDEVHIFTDEPQRTMSLLMNECKLESATVRESTLEDVFLKLTGRVLRE
jgi:lipooligosaccharide transport system ATP-binding protein